MSKNYDNYLKQIDANREEIAEVILSTIKELLPNLYKEEKDNYRDLILNKNKYFFLETSPFLNKVQIENKQLLKKLSDLVNFDVEHYLKTKKGGGAQLASSIADDASTKIYNKNRKLYSNFGITNATIRDIYSQGGMEKIEELNKVCRDLRENRFMFGFKSEFLTIFAYIKQGIKGKEFDFVKKKFNVETYDDLLKVNTELDSFLIDASKLSPEKRAIIEENRDNYRARIGKGKDYFISEKEVLKQKKAIEKVYNYNMYKQVFDKTNIKDFFEKFSYEYNGKNINKLVNIYFAEQSAGMHSVLNLDKGEEHFCFLSDDILSGSCDWINNVVVHETIHCLENYSSKKDVNFSRVYRSINEALTNDLTNRAKRKLSQNIIEDDEIKKNSIMLSSVYDSMDLLLAKLKKHPVYEYILESKFKNNVEELEEKVGVTNMENISRCFDKAFSLSMDNVKEQIECANELVGVLKRMNIAKKMSFSKA